MFLTKSIFSRPCRPAQIATRNVAGGVRQMVMKKSFRQEHKAGILVSKNQYYAVERGDGSISERHFETDADIRGWS